YEWQRADFMFIDQTGCIINKVKRMSDNHRLIHDFSYWSLEKHTFFRGRKQIGWQGLTHIPIRDNPQQPLTFHNWQVSDPMLAQQLKCLSNGGLRGYGDHCLLHDLF